MNGSDLIHGWWLGFALDIVVKATLILALGSLWTFRAQTPAAVRHRIWFGTFVALAMQGGCGAVIQALEHADGPVAVKLNRFGKAKLTVLDTEGKPKVGYTPTLRFGLRGIPASAAEQANTPAPREPVTWGQFSYTQLPISTDKQGVAKLDLIPGILYTMYYADERGAAAQRDFVLTQDQELDLGTIVVKF